MTEGGAEEGGATSRITAERIAVDWIAVDWGTSNLRLWAMTAGGTVLAERVSDRGMGRLAPADYEPALLELATPFLASDRVTDVVICGMAGARQGWREAPYLPVPCPPTGRGAVLAPSRDPRLRVHLLPGLSQADPPEVMRGEETQIAGILSTDPGFDGVLCLPGTHGKWVHLADGQVTGFRTAMTGELFALLASASVLRHSMGPEGAEDARGTGDAGGTGRQAQAFRDAVCESAARPEALTCALFSIRAADLLAGAAPGAPQGAGRARLSGLLIGAELAAMRAEWQAAPVTLIGAPEITAQYRVALETLGAEATIRLGAELALKGLAAAWQAIRGETR